MLVACRVLQGLGGALVLANVMADITAIFPREERRRAMAVNASVLAMGQTTGLVFGGFMIDRLGWAPGAMKGGPPWTPTSRPRRSPSRSVRPWGWWAR